METTPDKGAKNSGGHSQKKSRREKRSRREEHTPELHRRTEGSQTHHEHQTHTLTDQHVLMTNHDVNPYSRVRLFQETLSRELPAGKLAARHERDHHTTTSRTTGQFLSLPPTHHRERGTGCSGTGAVLHVSGRECARGRTNWSDLSAMGVWREACGKEARSSQVVVGTAQVQGPERQAGVPVSRSVLEGR